ncbi:MAG: outer membrane lipoprotein carrier protein LolA [Betaproteobacteria bacterium HGW-Betaproteobacteria-3]|jgi:outer membrane lipoprotein carrier protein|nr:MAG: outer membrane lipoprotein carrier protein LolA [Betaproteobacteria bacterium HGW-Betaproteobacteria-3]
MNHFRQRRFPGLKIAILFIATSVHMARADGLESLENFVRGVNTGRADFTQTVTAPAKSGQVARSKTSSGTFEFLRPNRFRFVYKKPFEQTIVADGQTLWLHDVDLNQVTARSQAQVLGSTPAALIAAAPDLKALQGEYSLQAAPEKDGMQWVLAMPKAKEGQLQSVRVGFRGNDLAVLEILDSFGQKSVLVFGPLDVSKPLRAADFQFKPPAGADVLRQ